AAGRCGLRLGGGGPRFTIAWAAMRCGAGDGSTWAGSRACAGTTADSRERVGTTADAVAVRARSIDAAARATTSAGGAPAARASTTGGTSFLAFVLGSKLVRIGVVRS